MVCTNLDEKYQPTCIDEVVGQPIVKEIMKELINQTTISLPHMLFTGPPGVGKTSVANALAKDLYGKNWEFNFYEFNASDSRGIEFIRSDIKRLTTIVPVGATFQIIFLDEADELTVQAQDALRQLMQKFTETTKFIFACNNPEKITPALKNRLATFEFKPFPDNLIMERLQYICGKEGITYDDGSLEMITQGCHGSPRQALISIARSVNRYNHLVLEYIQNDTIYLDELSTRKMLRDVLSGDVKTAEKQFLDLYSNSGQRYDNMFGIILDEVDRIDIDISLKQAIIETTGIYDARMADPNVTKSVQIKCYLNALAMIGANSGYVKEA